MGGTHVGVTVVGRGLVIHATIHGAAVPVVHDCGRGHCAAGCPEDGHAVY